MEIDDDSEVQFVCSKKEDGSCYSLSVMCNDGLTDEEYAACLVAFAKDIEDGTFKFDNDSGAAEILSQ